MKQLAVERALAGMVLSEDVLDRNSRPLLLKGSVLTASMIQGLSMWGVKSIWVEDTESGAMDAEADGEDSSPLLGRFWRDKKITMEEVDVLFSRNTGKKHPLIDYLYHEAELCVQGTLRKSRP